MNIVKKIILNNNYEFLISSFSRNTYNQDGRLVSTIYVSLLNPTSETSEQLRALAAYAITSLAIEVDNETVYSLSEIEGRINSIDESLGDDGAMRTSFTMGL